MHRYTYYYPLALDTPKPAVKYPVILNRMSPEVRVISSTTPPSWRCILVYSECGGWDEDYQKYI